MHCGETTRTLLYIQAAGGDNSLTHSLTHSPSHSLTLSPTHSSTPQDCGGIVERIDTDKFFPVTRTNHNTVYFFGIIDILQRYDHRKMAETAAKATRHKVEELSSVEPGFFARRFCEFMSNHIK